MDWLAGGSRCGCGCVRRGERCAGRTALAASGGDERPRARSCRGRVSGTIERPDGVVGISARDLGDVPCAGRVRGSARRLGGPAGACAASSQVAAPAPGRGRRAPLPRRVERGSTAPGGTGCHRSVRLREVHLEGNRAARRDAAEDRVTLLPRADEHREEVLVPAPGGEATLTRHAERDRPVGSGQLLVSAELVVRDGDGEDQRAISTTTKR